MLRALFFSILFVIAGFSPSSAAELTWWKDGKAHYFDGLPANKLLKPDEFSTYERLISEQKCDAAAIMLNRSFVERYPQFIHYSSELKDIDYDYRHWADFYVRGKHTELYLCQKRKQLKAIETAIAKHNLPTGIYMKFKEKQQPKHYKGSLWERRDGIVTNILMLAGNEFAPAYPVVADMLQNRNVFADPGAKGVRMQYYLLKRGCHLGLACGRFQPRLKELAKTLSPEWIRAIDGYAKTLNMVDGVFFY